MFKFKSGGRAKAVKCVLDSMKKLPANVAASQSMHKRVRAVVQHPRYAAEDGMAIMAASK